MRSKSTLACFEIPYLDKTQRVHFSRVRGRPWRTMTSQATDAADPDGIEEIHDRKTGSSVLVLEDLLLQRTESQTLRFSKRVVASREFGMLSLR